MINCTFWESYGSKFLNYYNQNKISGAIVIILTHALIKDAQGQFYLILLLVLARFSEFVAIASLINVYGNY
jgi:hypothetical protein